jgi:regulator of Ty1 transposition protein 109
MVLTSAISAHLYTFPSAGSSILYISKVDSSAQGPALPLTRKLVSSFIAYHLDPATRPTVRVRVQLFARSQGQYLFPNSAAGKKGLGGLKLCGWWKGLYEEAAREVVKKYEKRTSASASASASASEAGVQGNSGVEHGPGSGSGSELGLGIRLAYLLPSYSAGEAAGMLGPPRQPLPEGISWIYEPPFTTPVVLPSTSTSSGSSASDSASREPPIPILIPPSLAALIPSLPDDPKTRFLEELVDGSPHPPQPNPAARNTKRDKGKDRDGDSAGPASPKKRGGLSKKEREAAEGEAERKHASAALSKVSKEEFWERMGFRQECASGDVTGFFTAEVVAPTRHTAHSHSHLSSPDTHPGERSTDDPGTVTVTGTGTVDPSPTPDHALPHEIVDRLLTALLNTDFANLSFAVDGSAAWARSAKEVVSDEIGLQGWGGCVGTVVAKEGLEAGAGTGTGTGTGTGNGVGIGIGNGNGNGNENGAEKRKEETVTMLQPRKKKKV